MARSLSIPAIVGLHDVTEKLETGQHVLARWLQRLAHRQSERRKHSRTTARSNQARAKVAEQLTELRETKSTTRDGRHIVLSANIELPDDVEASPPTAPKESGFIARNSFISIATTLPAEEEQYETYRRVAERVRPDPLIIRTFDLGGDKIAPGTVDSPTSSILFWAGAPSVFASRI